MTKKTFRSILLLYVFFAILVCIKGSLFNNVPTEIEEVEIAYSVITQGPFFLKILFITTILISAFLFITGTIGMYFFWPVARWLFVAGIFLVSISFFASPWHTGDAVDAVLGNFEVMLEGIIIYLAFWGKAAPLFKKRVQ